MGSDALTVGPDPGGLTVRVIQSDTSWTGELVLVEVIDEGLSTQHDQVIPWPSAPTLHFEDGLVLSATLLTEESTNTADAVAQWSMTDLEIEDRRDGEDARVKVNGETWWDGVVRCLS